MGLKTSHWLQCTLPLHTLGIPPLISHPHPSFLHPSPLRSTSPLSSLPSHLIRAPQLQFLIGSHYSPSPPARQTPSDLCCDPTPPWSAHSAALITNCCLLNVSEADHLLQEGKHHSAWPGTHPTGSSQCKSTGVGRWEGRWVELGDAIYQYVSGGMCQLEP